MYLPSPTTNSPSNSHSQWLTPRVLWFWIYCHWNTFSLTHLARVYRFLHKQFMPGDNTLHSLHLCGKITLESMQNHWRTEMPLWPLWDVWAFNRQLLVSEREKTNTNFFWNFQCDCYNDQGKREKYTHPTGSGAGQKSKCEEMKDVYNSDIYLNTF